MLAREVSDFAGRIAGYAGNLTLVSGAAVGGYRALAEEADAIEDIYEPFLIQIGFLDRTPRGRVATQLAYDHFGIAAPRRQAGLF